MSHTALATTPTCVNPACTNQPAAACAQCSRTFCAEHGLVRGKRFRGLTDVCDACRNYSPLRYVAFILAVVGLLALCTLVARTFMGEAGVVFGLIAGTILAVVLLWRYVPE
jgi:hypothetical protein